jgi:nucleotide-binding universal stress UspA family protein
VTAPFRRVLVGWDGSPDSAEALSVAAQIVGRDGGHVVALAVFREGTVLEAEDDGDGGQPAIVRLAEVHFEELRRRPTATPVRLSAHLLVDSRNNAGKAVCDYAAEHGFDLLVLGRHGENGSRGTHLGHVAGEAAQRSQVPVLPRSRASPFARQQVCPRRP